MRTRWVVLGLVVLFVGALGGSLLTPQPAGAVSKEMIELQQTVNQLVRGQQDMRSAIDSNNAALRTLVQQSLDSMNGLNAQMGVLQKTVQEVQANTGSRIDTMTTQTQGLSDNMQDVQARVGKISQQLTDMQSLLQSIDAKLSGTAVPSSSSAAGGGPVGPGASAPNPAISPISSDTLYQNALRDFSTGKYDLSRQEFSDYLKNFPTNDLASNAQFYLGEIDYAQSNFKEAIVQYDLVLTNYTKSFKMGAALLKKGMAELEMGMKATGTRDLRGVVQRFPGSDEARRAQAKLKELGVSPTPRSSSPH